MVIKNSVSELELSEWLGLSDRRVRGLVKSGHIPKNTGKGYDLKACIRGYVNYLKSSSSSGSTAGDDTDYWKEKTELTKQQRISKEMENAKIAGELVDAFDVERSMSELVKIVVTALETLPDILERDTGIDGAAIERTQNVVNDIRKTLYDKLG